MLVGIFGWCCVLKGGFADLCFIILISRDLSFCLQDFGMGFLILIKVSTQLTPGLAAVC